MRGGWSWIGWGIAVLGLAGLPVWSAEPDPEAVRRLMEKYEREAEAEKSKPAPAPQPAPKPRPPAPPPSVQPEPRWISNELVNVRGGPGPEHPAITQLARGSEITWLGASTENPDWQRIRLSDGRVAYVHGNLLSRQRIAAAPAPAPTPPAPRPATPPARPGFEPKMVRIPAGCFQMGSPASEAGRDPDENQHRVCVEAFDLGEDEVTVREFKRFVESTGHRTDAERNAGDAQGCWVWSDGDGQGSYRAGHSWRKPGYTQHDNYPVVCVSWNDAVAYTVWLNQETGQSYRLPTEAEWEYAARAGITTARYWGNDPNQACRYANVADQAKSPKGLVWTEKHDCSDGYWYPAPVGRFRPNAWQLNDLLGNVWEWTCSLYDQDYGGAEQECNYKDTSGPRSSRGGSWNTQPARVRSAFRDGLPPTDRLNNVGFRLARSL